MPRKIVFIVPYPLGQSPSQRFRFEQYFAPLEQNGFAIHVEPFLPPQFGKLFFQSGKMGLKLWIIIQGFVSRVRLVFRIREFDFVFIHREAAPLGPPIFEWLIKEFSDATIVYDFDDAIWLTDNAAEGWIQRSLKWRSKVGTLCRWANRVSCGTTFLMDFAHKFNNDVRYIPSVLDTNRSHNPERFRQPDDPRPVVIGWTGSHSTLKYLKLVEDVLLEIEQTYDVEFMVIADRPPQLSIKKMKFVPWRADTEVRDLLNFDIGIMPLPDDEWSRGKGGFKLLQYMSLEIPVVASAVGVNRSIVAENENGFLCTSREEWIRALSRLIRDTSVRKKFGENGRRVIQAKFSVDSNCAAFLDLFA